MKRKISEAIPVAELRRQFRYDPETGLLFWLTSYKHFHAGRIAGLDVGRGYLGIKISRRMCLAHRVAWAIYHGDWPEHQIDHINGDPSDNRISNLRHSTQSQNMGNRKISKNNRSGYKGVRKRTDCDRWEAAIEMTGSAGRRNRKSRYLGSFKTPQQAHAAYVAAAKEYFGEFARSS